MSLKESGHHVHGYLSRSVWLRLQFYCASNERSIAWVIRKAINEFLNRHADDQAYVKTLESTPPIDPSELRGFPGAPS